MNFPERLVQAVGRAAMLALACAAISAQEPAFLFLEEVSPAEQIRNGPPVITAQARSRPATVNGAVLRQLSEHREVSCRIKLSAGEERVATLTRTTTSDAQYRVLRGSLEDADSQILLVTDGEYLAGTVHIPGRGSFRIVPKGPRRCELNELAVPKLPLCGARPGLMAPALLQGRNAATENREHAMNAPAAQNASDFREIEVMMLYTAQSRMLAGDVAAIEAQARVSIEEANSALANSNAGVRFRVVHMAEVDYQASGALESDLDRLTAPFDGVMDEIHAWRDSYKADLVCLVVERSDTSLQGLGHFATGPDHGFSVVAMPYLTGYYLVAHELGHNLGCDHDRQNAVGGGAFQFSYGYRFDVNGTTHRTVMAYPPGLLLPYYSNPDLAFEGVPLGIPAGSPDEADNSRTIRQMAAFVDSYRGIEVQLTHPSIGDAFGPNEPIEITALVTSEEGPVSGVEFFDGDLSLGSVTSAPYHLSWNNAAPGRHELSAHTRIDGGGEVRSPIIGIAVRPENDDFANRQVLSGISALGTAILYGATSEMGEPTSVRNAGVSAWWTWKAPQSGVVRISAAAAAPQQKTVFVFSGATLDSLQPVELTPVSKNDFLFKANGGEDYQICVAGSPGSAPVSVSLSMELPPPNDDFLNAQVIKSAVGTFSGSTIAATSEPGEPSIGAYPLGHSIWFRWVPPASGRASLSLGAGVTQADFGVYTGTDVASLTLAASSAAALDSFPVQAAESYYIGVDGAFQQIKLNLNLLSLATNDNFSRRAQLVGSGLLTIDPATCTREANEPVHGTIVGGHSLWWTWRATFSGGVNMARLPVGTPLPDLNVAWYTGSALSNLVRLGSFDFTNSLTELAVFPVSAGTNYVIALESGAGQSQNLQLEFKQTSPDGFRARQPYTSGNLRGTTLGATAEPGEPAHGGEPAAHSTWWSWTTVTGRTVSVTVDGAGKILPRLSVYEGTALTNLLLIAENSTNGQVIGPTVTFTAAPRARYSFAIDETLSSFSYVLSMQSTTNPTNDNFAHAQLLPGQFQFIAGSTIDASLEPGEPDHSQNPAESLSGSVWYTWSAPAQRDVTVLALARRSTTAFQMRARLPEPLVAIYEGDNLHTLTPISSGVGSVAFRTARKTYKIAVAARPGEAQDFSLTLVDVPVNDQFEKATPLLGTVSIPSVQLRAATADTGEPNHAGASSGHSLWWSWTAARSGLYLWAADPRSISQNSAPVSLVTAIYTGTNLATLSVVASNLWSGVAFSAEAEKKYYLVVDLADPRVASDLASQYSAFRFSLSRYPVLLPPRLGDEQDIEFSINGSVGQTLSIQASSDFVRWLPVRQIYMPSSDYKYSEPASVLKAQKFFRVLMLQNGAAGSGE